MKHKEKRVEYAQDQTMCAKQWRKVVFSDEKKFNLVLARKKLARRELLNKA